MPGGGRRKKQANKKQNEKVIYGVWYGNYSDYGALVFPLLKQQHWKPGLLYFSSAHGNQLVSFPWVLPVTLTSLPSYPAYQLTSLPLSSTVPTVSTQSVFSVLCHSMSRAFVHPSFLSLSSPPEIQRAIFCVSPVLW